MPLNEDAYTIDGLEQSRFMVSRGLLGLTTLTLVALKKYIPHQQSSLLIGIPALQRKSQLERRNGLSMIDKRNNLNEYNWIDFFDEFQKETPRSAAIISGAFLDALLRDLLKSFMIDDKKNVDGLLGTESNSETPIGSFGARIKTAYCLGLISEMEFNDLKLIKNIRNRFAHKLHGYSFDDREIVKWCNNLRTPESFKVVLSPMFETHYGKYVLTVSILTTVLGVRILNVQNDRRVARRDTLPGQEVKVEAEKANEKVAG